MQVHIALSAPLRWRDERLDSVPIVHLRRRRRDEVSLACAQAAAGLLPRRPTVVVGQPTAIDPSRAPEGAAILWMQLQEVPRRAGRRRGRRDRGGRRRVERGADRSLRRARSSTAFALMSRISTDCRCGRGAEARRSWSGATRTSSAATSTPATAALDQSYLWRPLPGFGSHATAGRGPPVRRQHLSGARGSTPPRAGSPPLPPWRRHDAAAPSALFAAWSRAGATGSRDAHFGPSPTPPLAFPYVVLSSISKLGAGDRGAPRVVRLGRRQSPHPG